jgi:hypothetical protein
LYSSCPFPFRSKLHPGLDSPPNPRAPGLDSLLELSNPPGLDIRIDPSNRAPLGLDTLRESMSRESAMDPRSLPNRLCPRELVKSIDVCNQPPSTSQNIQRRQLA